jgi:hypothetical protein
MSLFRHHATTTKSSAMRLSAGLGLKPYSVAPLLLVLACGQPGAVVSTPAPRTDRVHVESQHVDYDIASTAEGSEIRALLPYSAADAWRALPRVYADLGVPVETVDADHRILVGVVSARRTFANSSLSALIDCGSTLMGQNANSYNVRLHLQNEVDSVDKAQATIRTVLTATAASDGGATVRCSSTGQLERLITNRVSGFLIQEKK